MKRVAVLVLLPLAALAGAQTTYRKIEAMVPMRDGVRLCTEIYVPENAPGKHPILMERTPYSAGPYGTARRNGFRGSKKLQDAGYVFVYQDVRGRYMSEGEFVNVRPQLKPGEKGIDESTDTYDTVEWLVKNVPDNNGAVGLWGISYPGFYAGVGALSRHPALKATSPQAPVSDWWTGDDFHHHGAFFLQDAFNFLRFFGQPRPRPNPNGTDPAPPLAFPADAGPYEFHLKTGPIPEYDRLHLQGKVAFWKDLVDHPDYDAFWRDRALPDKMRDVRCAVLTVGGWFDAEDLWGALNLYGETERRNRRADNTLVMGPWYHGMWAGRGGRTFGDLDFGSDTANYFQENVEFPFFEKNLRGVLSPATPEAHVFETGANRWATFPEWPPKAARERTVYLGPDRTLADAPTKPGAAEYVADPAKPTPYLADPATPRRTREYMVDDQRFATARADVATFRGEALTAPLTLAGPIEADLRVTTTGTDGDFVVKVVDEWPADSAVVSPKGVPMRGYQQLVRFEILRGRYRNDPSRPEPFVPDRPTRVRVPLNDVFHTFLPGHRMVVQVQSSLYPLADRNPNAFVPIMRARAEDFRPATVRILLGGRDGSRLRVRTLDSGTPGKGTL